MWQCDDIVHTAVIWWDVLGVDLPVVFIILPLLESVLRVWVGSSVVVVAVVVAGAVVIVVWLSRLVVV